MTQDKLLDYFFEIEKLKKTKRYGKYDASYSDSVPEHSFFVTLLGIKLMEHFDLKLDFKKVVKMCLYHDLSELNLKHDFDAPSASKSGKVKAAKKAHEEKTLAYLVDSFGQSDLAELSAEYGKWKTPEACFAKALDRLETLFHIINCDTVKIQDEDFTATYCNTAISRCPELKPFYDKVRERLRQRFEKDGIPWKDSYN